MKTPPRFGPRHPRLGRLAHRAALPLLRAFGAHAGFHSPGDAWARELGRAFEAAMEEGEPIHLLGIGLGNHDAGVSLVEIDRDGCIRLLASYAEERFRQVKQYARFPSLSIAALRRRMDELEIAPDDVFACFATFDYANMLAHGVKVLVEELPGSTGLVSSSVYPEALGPVLGAMLRAERLAEEIGFSETRPILGMPHHGNHAAFAWASSPFAHSPEKTLIAALDASGDDGSASMFLAEDGRIRQLFSNESYWDSLGHLYGFLSSSYGGWPLGRAEGRWMAAAAYGDGDRRSNPYYERLRALIRVTPGGRFEINRAIANWHNAGYRRPFADEMLGVLGEPIPRSRFFHPEFMLQFSHEPDDHDVRRRVDRAAATQLVFEDGLFGILEHWIRETRATRVILTGGTALNCVANMRVLERFDEAWFEAELGMADTRLVAWVPPVPGDDGAHPGAPFQFALQHGARPAKPLRTAFFGGRAGRLDEIHAALKGAEGVAWIDLDRFGEEGRVDAADFLAFLVSQSALVGLYQGEGEIGQRALGHRSIVADPRSPTVAREINRRVKFREDFRPVAPMCTLAAAQAFFDLSLGAAAGDYSAYHWMSIAARAKPEARRQVPGVIHHDGSVRLQIVPREDRFTHMFLRALGQRIGVEMSVNTSLNVGTPIVQDAEQAARLLARSDGLDGLLFLSDDGAATFAWRERASARGSSVIQGEAWLEIWQDSAPDDPESRLRLIV